MKAKCKQLCITSSECSPKLRFFMENTSMESLKKRGRSLHWIWADSQHKHNFSELKKDEKKTMCMQYYMLRQSPGCGREKSSIHTHTYTAVPLGNVPKRWRYAHRWRCPLMEMCPYMQMHRNLQLQTTAVRHAFKPGTKGLGQEEGWQALTS